MTGTPTPAVAATASAGVPYRLHAFDHVAGAGGYAEEAVRHLGVDPARVLKTLVVDDGTGLVVAVVPAPARLDLKALAASVGSRRCTLAEPAAAERATGYVVGAISPLGQRRRLRTVVDRTATRHDTVFVSAGRRGLELELAPADLVRLTDATVATIGR